jgi:iron complex outermembrane receptor protein
MPASPHPLRLHFALVTLLLAMPLAARAQASAAPAASAPTRLDRVEVTGERAGDTEQRRQSTAAKIIIGRDEIERYGDSTVGELLKRLPGVTIQGAPGRGGAIRLRGLGGGYTQILLDGERVPPGFSLDSLAPEQIERIEILRAPTAETGARAIAGTINIVTREAYRKRINDLRVGGALENGRLQSGGSWTRNDAVGAWTHNLSLTAFHRDRDGDSVTTTTDERLADGATTLAQSEHERSRERGDGLHGSARLQWRGDKGEVLTLAPFVVHSDAHTRRNARLQQSTGGSAPPYDRADADTDGRFTLLRLNAQWNHRLGEDTRLEWRGGVGDSHSVNHTLRHEFDAANTLTRTLDDRADVRDRSASLSTKLSRLLAEEHSGVAGAEAERTRRREGRRTLQDGAPLLADFGENLSASTSRFALYVQDEWNPTPHWAANAGLRWEGITTRGDAEDGGTQSNRSSVWTPLAHAVWKPDPKGRDQVRISLTRSYRAPTLPDLIARPSISTRFPLPGPNSPTAPDRAGNPGLRPELARGIDLAIERYLQGGGLLSANLFRRELRDTIRNLTALETVPWSSDPRWVSRPQSVGDAVTQGLELEAKFRLSEVWPELPKTDVRANASFFRSRVKSVPGPDNRLDRQPGATLNLGADHRVSGVPLTVGGNLNWNPAYSTRLSESQTAYQGRKRVFDAYALWRFDSARQLRLSASNLAPNDYLTGGSVTTDALRETAQTTARSFVNWQLRLELKL